MLILLRSNNVQDPICVAEVRAILDCGSQRTYITRQTQRVLSLEPLRTESMMIKIFGASGGTRQTCHVVELGVITINGEQVILTALVVSVVCLCP